MSLLEGLYAMFSCLYANASNFVSKKQVAIFNLRGVVKELHNQLILVDSGSKYSLISMSTPL